MIKAIIRKDTIDNWNNENPILKRKELVAATNGERTFYKIGDGVSAFREINYVYCVAEIEEFSIYDNQDPILTVCLNKDVGGE